MILDLKKRRKTFGIAVRDGLKFQSRPSLVACIGGFTVRDFRVNTW